ncbi:MAG: TRAP transporter substrate-binding protein [Candidatus Hodarchaeota archaeon]
MNKKKDLTRREFCKSAILAGTVISGSSLLAGGTKIVSAREPRFNFRYSGYDAPGTVNSLVADKFVELVKKKSNGEIHVTNYYSSQLGTEKGGVEGVRVGTIDFAHCAGALAMWLPMCGVAELPFIFNDYLHAYRALSGPYIEYISPSVEKVGFKILGGGANTPRSTLAKKPLAKLADWKGLKIRVPEVPIFIETFKAFGAIPTPIAAAEIYNALQTGIVDAFDSAVVYLASNKGYEICRYLNMTEHIINSEQILMNMSKFKSLPKHLQKVLEDSGREAFEFYKLGRLPIVDVFLKEMLDAGVNVVMPDREELANATKSIRESFVKKHNLQELVEKIKKA